MKKIIFVLLLGISMPLWAQKNKVVSSDVSKIIYENALKYGDVYTAINSIHAIIAQEGEHSTYKDSLAIAYYKINSFMSSYLVAQELLKKKPKNIQILEIEAVSLQNLGETKKAVAAYEQLFALSKNQYHGYQLATLQTGLKRLGEANLTVEQAMQYEAMPNFYLDFPVDKERSQKVPLKAALLNLKGLIAFELKDNAIALKSFEDAVLAFPEFKMAQTNLASLKALPTQSGNSNSLNLEPNKN